MRENKKNRGWERTIQKPALNQALGWERDNLLKKEGGNMVKKVKRNLQLPLKLVYSHPQQVSNTTYQIALKMYLNYHDRNTTRTVKYTKKEIAALSAACNKTVLKALKELEAIGVVVAHQGKAGEAIHYSLAPVKDGQFFDSDSIELRLVKLTMDELRLYTALCNAKAGATINDVIEIIRMPYDKAAKAIQHLAEMSYLIKVGESWHAIK